MIEQLELQKLWFVTKKHEAECEFDTDNNLTDLTIWADVAETTGYHSLSDIPKEKTENAVLFQTFQFHFNNVPVTIEKSTKLEKYHHVFFTSEEDALFFKQELIDEMEDNYWTDDEERSALIDLGYEFEDGEDFSEISINEDRRWHEHLRKWFLRSFDGLGYKLHLNDEIIEF